MTRFTISMVGEHDQDVFGTPSVLVLEFGPLKHATDDERLVWERFGKRSKTKTIFRLSQSARHCDDSSPLSRAVRCRRSFRVSTRESLGGEVLFTRKNELAFVTLMHYANRFACNSGKPTAFARGATKKASGARGASGWRCDSLIFVLHCLLLRRH